MPSFKTKNFGVLSYQAEAVVEFPGGLPAFESRRLFLALRFDDSAPLIFLQQPATIQSDLDRFKASQTADIRYTAIPFTVLFAEGRFDQDRIGQFEEETGAVPTAFLRDTDYANNRRDLRAGFSTSPWSWLSWSAHYRNDLSDNDYNNKRDEALGGPGIGYSAFIRARTIRTDEVETKLLLRPARWLKTTASSRRCWERSTARGRTGESNWSRSAATATRLIRYKRWPAISRTCSSHFEASAREVPGTSSGV